MVQMTAHLRRAAALDAIDRVLAGAMPGSLECETLDFKEEAGTVDRRGIRRPIDARHEPAAVELAAAAACFANSDTGGVLVVGVDDTAVGPAAFVGAHLDTRWLRERIYALTKPPLSIDVIEQREIAGRRTYLINIAPAMELIRSGDRLRRRFGTRCEELSGDAARLFLESRIHYDWSAEASGWRLSQASDAALATGWKYYQEDRGHRPTTKAALASQLGLVYGGVAENPELNQAGALLLCPLDPGWTYLDLILARAAGRPSYARIERPAPLLVAIDEVLEELDRAFMPDPEVPRFQRHERRSIPRRAYREAFINAVMHRDYRHPNGRIVVTVIGWPATMLRVESPGGFPPGVSKDRLLTTPSRSRNPVLAHALHTLGLAEREGIGVDMMYRSMLHDGHGPPEIAEHGGDVLCILRGGKPDDVVRGFFDGIVAANRDLEYDVRAFLAITQLLHAPVLRPETLAELAHCGSDDAYASLEALEQTSALERLANRSRSFRLSMTARERLRSRLVYSTRLPIHEHWEAVRAYLDTHADIGRADAMPLLGLHATSASRVLSTLANDLGYLEPVDKSRGRSVRYRLTGR